MTTCVHVDVFLITASSHARTEPQSVIGRTRKKNRSHLAQAALQPQNTPRVVSAFFARPTAMEDAAVNRLAKSITQLTLCQVTTDEVDAATKLLDKACQKLRGIPDVPSQRITDLEAAIRQMRQLSCILDSCTISASYEVSQAQKAILLMPRTAKGASTSSEELNAQISPRTDDEHNLPAHEDYWQEH